MAAHAKPGHGLREQAAQLLQEILWAKGAGTRFGERRRINTRKIAYIQCAVLIQLELGLFRSPTVSSERDGYATRTHLDASQINAKLSVREPTGRTDVEFVGNVELAESQPHGIAPEKVVDIFVLEQIFVDHAHQPSQQGLLLSSQSEAIRTVIQHVRAD